MKTVCIMNLKGGTGKTVTSINLAALLAARHSKRVLLIDADHQGNASSFFHAELTGDTLLEVLLGASDPYWENVVQQTEYEGLDILPTDMSLAELDATPVPEAGQALRRLREFLDVLTEDAAYDYAVIDMPPAFSFAARAALLAADEVIVPIKLDAFSVAGMAELRKQVSSMSRINPRLTLVGVLVTMWRNAEVIVQAERVLRDSNVPVFQSVIRRTDIVDESTFQREPLYLYSPHSAACVDYKRFAAEYLEGREQRGEADEGV